MQRYLEYLWMGQISNMRELWALGFGDQTEDETASPKQEGVTPPPSPPSELASAGFSLNWAGAASGSGHGAPPDGNEHPRRRRRTGSAQSATSTSTVGDNLPTGWLPGWVGTVGDNLPMGWLPGCKPVDSGGATNAHLATQRSGGSRVVIVEPVGPEASQVSAAGAANAAAQGPAIPVPLGGRDASGDGGPAATKALGLLKGNLKCGDGGPAATKALGLLKGNSKWNVVRANKSDIALEKWTAAVNDRVEIKPASVWTRTVNSAKAAASVNEKKKKKRDALFSKIDLDGDGSITLKEILIFFLQKSQQQWVVSWSLSLLFAPAVLVCPPLEQLGVRSRSTCTRYFNMPPGLRFYLQVASELTLVIMVSTEPMPIHRDLPDPYRDWILLLYAIASFVKEVEFVVCRGIAAYVSDPYNSASFLAGILLVASQALNVCNGVDWFFYKGDGLAPETTYPAGDFRSMIQLWERCDESIVPLGGREILAAAVMLRWLIVIPKMVNRMRSFGPLFLMVQPMMVDVMKWLVLLTWVLATFGMFFNIIYKEVMPQPSPTVDLTVGLPPRFSLLPVLSLT